MVEHDDRPLVSNAMRRRRLRESLGVWLLSVLCIAGFGLLAQFIPFVAENLLAFVAASFLYLPAAALWRRGHNLEEFGLTLSPLRRGMVYASVAVIVTFPPFIMGWRCLLYTSDAADEV